MTTVIGPGRSARDDEAPEPVEPPGPVNPFLAASARSTSTTVTRTSVTGESRRAKLLAGIGETAAVTVLAVCVGLAFNGILSRSTILAPVLGAALVGVALSTLLTRVLRAPAWFTMPAFAIGWILDASATVLRHDATAGLIPNVKVLNDLHKGLSDGPHQMLTTVLPMRGTSTVLVLVHACVWLAAVAGAELAARTRPAMLPALVPVLVLGVPAVLGTGRTGTDTGVVVAFAAAVALLLLTRSRGPRAPLALLSTAVPAAVALALAAGVAVPALPGSSRHAFDLRNVVSQPAPSQIVGPNPLDYVSAWLQNPETPMFTVKGGVKPGDLMRLTVLDSFDGTTWHPASSLTPTDERVPGASGETGPYLPAVKQDVTVQNLRGVWLPALDRPQQVTGAGTVLGVDPGSGSLADPTSELHPGLHYTVESRPTDYEPEKIQYDQVVYDPAMTQLPTTDVTGAAIPAVDRLRQQAQEATAGATFPYQQALRLANWLRQHYAYDITALSGHTYRSLEYFLDTDKRGTPEQFATAFAVLARSLALPARVAVGFRASAMTTAPDGTVQVRSGDVTAWAEVDFQGVGWVPFFPTPDQATIAPRVAPPQTAAPMPKASPSASPSADATATTAPDARSSQEAQIAAQSHGGAALKKAKDNNGLLGGLPAWALVTGTAGTLFLLAWAWVVSGPWRRRRARARGDARTRVLGAWDQVVESLTWLGLPPAALLTAQDIAEFGTKRLDGEAGAELTRLAELVNRVLYSPGRVDEPAAARAWQACAVVEAAVRESGGRRALWARRLVLRGRPRLRGGIATA